MGSGQVRHFMEGEGCNRSIGRCHIVLQVLVVHVRLPEFTRFPVLVEQEMSRIFIVLVQIVTNAAIFRAGEFDKLFKFSLYQVNCVCFRFDICNDR